MGMMVSVVSDDSSGRDSESYSCDGDMIHISLCLMDNQLLQCTPIVP